MDPSENKCDCGFGDSCSECPAPSMPLTRSWTIGVSGTGCGTCDGGGCLDCMDGG
jgi:hypothetical protein